MDTTRTFSADTEAGLWQQVAADMASQGELFEYEAVLHHGGYQVQLDIDIDLGGGFESGSESTTLTAPVPGHVALRFALHEQDWMHELGKLLGLTDIELGDPELDAAYIITANDPAALRAALANPVLRQTLLRYPGLRLVLAPESHAPDSDVFLTAAIDRALPEPAQLQEVYHLLLVLLQQIAPPPGEPTVTG